MIEMKECVLSRSRDSIGTLSNSHKDSKTFAPQKTLQPQPTSEKKQRYRITKSTKNMSDVKDLAVHL